MNKKLVYQVGNNKKEAYFRCLKKYRITVSYFFLLTALPLTLDRGQYLIDPLSVSLQAEWRRELIYPRFQWQYSDLLSWKMRSRNPKARVNKIIPPSQIYIYIYMYIYIYIYIYIHTLKNLKNACISNSG